MASHTKKKIKQNVHLRQPIKKDGLLRQPIACYEIAEGIRFCYDIREKSYNKYDPCYAVPRSMGVRRERQGGHPPSPKKKKHLKTLHGKYKMNKITFLNSSFIRLIMFSLPEELLTFCSV